MHLFFAISGFVTLMTLGRSQRARLFAASRFARLFPAYWGVIALTTATLLLLPLPDVSLHTGQVLANLTMLHRWIEEPGRLHLRAWVDPKPASRRERTPRRLTAKSKRQREAHLPCIGQVRARWDMQASVSGTGLWYNADPFGGRAVTRMDLFAINSPTCWNGIDSHCSDQSDYVFRSLKATAVPEPGTLSLLGLASLGVARRKRNA